MAKERLSSKNSNSSNPAASFKYEVLLWIVLAFSIILFISNFGIAGTAGRWISSIFFGLFGFLAYIFPILLFAGTAFLIANKDNKTASAKAVIAAVFLIFTCMFFELIAGRSENPLEACIWAVQHRYGGGLAGGFLVWLVRPHLGIISAYIIDIAVLIICMVLITERSLWKKIQSGSRKVYHTARNETVRQRRQHEERRLRRMDNKVTGVSLNTSIKDAVKPKVSDAVNELRPDPELVQDFPINMFGKNIQKQAHQKQAQSAETFSRAAVGMDTGFQNAFPYSGNIIPMTGQKAALKSEPKPEPVRQPSKSPAVQQADDILAKTSDLFSELLPGIDSQAVPDEAETYDSASAPRGLDNIDIDIIEEELMPELQAGVYAEEPVSDFQTDTDTYIKEPDSGLLSESYDEDLLSGTIGEEEEPLSAASDEDLLSGTLLEEGYNGDYDDIFSSITQRETDTEKPAPEARPVPEARQVPAASPAPEAKPAPEARPVPAASSAVHRNPKQPLAEAAAGVTDIEVQISENQPPVKQEHIFPAAGLLKRGDPNQTGDSRQHLQEMAYKLQQTLKNFGVNVSILNVSCGPSVTRYEIQPEMGVKVSKVVNLADDIKLNLAAVDIRIEAPIPGKAAIGIEVPNKETVIVRFRDLIESEEFRQHKSPCAFAVGRDIAGSVIVTDICKMPHLLIAGATGAGKSVCINTIIMSILYKADPDDVKLIMIDPKVVELSVYNGIPHLLLPVVTDPKKAAGALHWAVSEMDTRYDLFSKYGVRDMKGYNAKIKQIEHIADEDKPQKMPYIVIIVDELADLMMTAPGDVEDAICRLAQKARAAGIHLIIATQRPSVNVITGLIKANMPSRIAFSVTSGIDSRTILDMNGAEKLLGKGDMLFYPQGYQKPVRVQGAFISDSEVSKVVEFLTEQNGISQYSNELEAQVVNASAGPGGNMADAAPENDKDVYFADAARLLMDKDKASVSMLQRYFKIGFNRAARIMDQLEDAGIVGPEEGTKPRKILMTPEEFAQYEEEIL